jgi:hypothetical protein
MKAHVCIGGPLDGNFATSTDFSPEYGTPGSHWYTPLGKYAQHQREYFQFNTAYHRATVFVQFSKKLGRKREECHVVWIHRSLLQTPLTLKEARDGQE